MSTAISEIVSETMVKPICAEPFQRRLEGRLALFDVTGDVLDHHNGVVHHEAGGDGQCHQAQVIQAVSEQIHHAKRPDQGKGHRNAGNNGSRQVAQEEENDHHHQRHGQHQLEFHVVDGSPNGGGPVGQNADLDGGRQRLHELIEQHLDAVHDGNDIGARLALNVHDDGRRVVHPGGLADILDVVLDARHVGQVHRGAVPVGHDQRAVVRTGEQLIVRANLIGLVRAVKTALRLVHVGSHDGVAQVFQVEAVGRHRGRIGANPHGGFLPAADADQAHPW